MNTSTVKITRIPAQEIPYYSQKDLAYQNLEEGYTPFYAFKPSMNGLKSAISERKSFPVDRTLLHAELSRQYAGRELSSAQKRNLESILNDNTYTVTTAHQPSLLTGPLYYIFKIASTINLAERLNSENPDNHIVPIFISGGEDHDFDEINHFRHFGKKYSWTRDDAGGSVGKMSLDGIQSVVDELFETYGSSPHAETLREIVGKAIESAQRYKDINAAIVHSLFRTYGLLYVDMDNEAMKRAFIPHIKTEILTRNSQGLVLETQNKLAEAGYKSQAFPRDINFFLTSDNRRDRIEYVDGRYQIVNTEDHYSEEEILDLLDKQPERFSPNVVMRPIYQESILPNLAYIGGGGEIAYWLERKSQFEAFNVFFPTLIRRNSAALLPGSASKQLNKLDFSLADMLPVTDDIINNFLDTHSNIELDFSAQKETMEGLFNDLAEKATSIDPTISKWIQAERTKQVKVIDQIEGRLRRSIKSKEETKVNQIRKLKDKLFPENNLQERKDNFMQFYLSHGAELIDMLVENLNPLENDFLVVEL